MNEIRAFVYRQMCRFGRHDMGVLPTLSSINEGTHDVFEVRCRRCGKPTSNVVIQLLVRLLNKKSG